MSHFKAKMHKIRFLASVRLSVCFFVCWTDTRVNVGLHDAEGSYCLVVFRDDKQQQVR